MPTISITTALGRFNVFVDLQNAPITAGNFLAYVDQNYLNNAVIERLLTPENDDSPRYKIGVIQWGTRDPDKVFAPIQHEPTSVTGLSHTDGTLSLARPPNGTGQSLFFICMGDHPCLDHGGLRYEDQQGFAAFGRVIEGMGVLRSIYARAEPQDYLAAPIQIHTVQRV